MRSPKKTGARGASRYEYREHRPYHWRPRTQPHQMKQGHWPADRRSPANSAAQYEHSTKRDYRWQNRPFRDPQPSCRPHQMPNSVLDGTASYVSHWEPDTHPLLPDPRDRPERMQQAWVSGAMRPVVLCHTVSATTGVRGGKPEYCAEMGARFASMSACHYPFVCPFHQSLLPHYLPGRWYSFSLSWEPLCSLTWESR